MPTLWSWTQGWAATVSMVSYPSMLCAVSKNRYEPPLHPLPRMFTPT